MSAIRYGGWPIVGGRSRIAPAKDSRASWSPLITSGSMPNTDRTIDVNSLALLASRLAEVATIRTRSAPDAAISPA